MIFGRKKYIMSYDDRVKVRKVKRILKGIYFWVNGSKGLID